MDEAAPAEAGAAAEKKRPLLRRIPTPLIVTLVGIALTAWLLPAFTRQWDDRQKARDLKAAIDADMASATADALTGGDAVIASRAWIHPTFKPSAAETKWARASLEIQAKLQTYFSEKVAIQWQRYAGLVDSVLAVAANRLDVGSSTVIVGDAAPEPTGSLTTSDYEDMAKAVDKYSGILSDTVSKASKEALKGRDASKSQRAEEAAAAVIVVYHGNTQLLLRLEQMIAADVLKSHVKGYSTTTHDLIHDLIP